ncbi:MAG: N-acetylmuramoyl-L-alanine amidase [Alphaproteobacteria bacterium]|nr:N-acetylmuramoyl-L-alanine amidase [Alphaproteobacteria bacterium]
MKILKAPSPNFNERTLPIDTIVIHYTNKPTVEEALAWLTDPLKKLSAHYLIDEEGRLYQLVPEEKRAWHAGESYWQGCTDINSCSLGIELANGGADHGYTPFPSSQIDTLLRLCEDLRTRWSIPTHRILGHSDVAPRRKQDPGHLFPWELLAKEGLGLWPKEIREGRGIDMVEALSRIGYETLSPTQTLLAFQRHFQPHKMDGLSDHETLSLLQSLLQTQECLALQNKRF